MPPTVTLTPEPIDGAIHFSITTIFAAARGQDSWDMRFEGNDMRGTITGGYTARTIDVMRHPRTYFDDDSDGDYSFLFTGTKSGTTYRSLESCVRKGHSITFGVLVQNGADAHKLKRVSIRKGSDSSPTDSIMWDIAGGYSGLKWTGIPPGTETSNADEAYFFTLTRKMDGTFTMQGTWVEYQ